jgi:hypothetical protein
MATEQLGVVLRYISPRLAGLTYADFLEAAAKAKVLITPPVGLLDLLQRLGPPVVIPEAAPL